MKSISGQYECLHRSGIGLDYFTSRIDRLTLQANGQFIFVVQDRSRVSHAAKSLFSGQQIDVNAPETQRKGRYTNLGDSISFNFDDGTQEKGQLTPEGIQIGNNFYEKVSDLTLLPPTHRLKSNMEDIAKGLKIAGAIGGAAVKAAKTIQDTLQTTQGTQANSASPLHLKALTNRIKEILLPLINLLQFLTRQHNNLLIPASSSTNE